MVRCAGGMHVFQAGAVGTIVFPAIVFALPLVECRALFALWVAYGLVLLACSAPIVNGLYAGVVFPLYHTTLAAGMATVLIPAGKSAAPIVVAVAALSVFKIGVCMSVCLHRFAAHAAFKCGPTALYALCVLGCLANQGGPLWWASQHRCHHKFCDQPRDPHSPTQMGIVRAFGFFVTSPNVNEDFVPPHLPNTLPMRLLDTFSIVPVMLEQLLAYRCGGITALWVVYTADWVSQTVSLWFNIVNHPPGKGNRGCVAQNGCDPSKVERAPSVLFSCLNRLLWIPGLVGEDAHEHHHEHARDARRPGHDLPYHLFIRPLEAVGILWHVK